MVVPALNEADNLVETIPQAIAVLQEMGGDYEVLVIDDGSKDSTPQVMRKLCEKRIRTCRSIRAAPECRQSSGALHRIRSWQTNDVLVMMDADGQDEPREIPTLDRKAQRGDSTS